VGSRVTAVSLGQKGQLVCGGGGLHRSTATVETTGVRSQAFYRNSKLGTSDFCENVGSESAAYIVLESQPRGLQARFTQSLAFASQYEEVTDAAERKSLQALLDEYLKKS
jgi:hypothetical protein